MPTRTTPTATTVFTLALAACLTSAAPGQAQTDVSPYGMGRSTLPETLLLPVRVERDARPVSWIISHRNSLTGPDTPLHEVQSHIIFPARGDGTDGLVSWAVTRTRNDACSRPIDTPCPDLVSILSVPDGYVSVPQQAWVNEGAVYRFYIVPAGNS